MVSQYQKTLAGEITLSGVGLHTGKDVTVTLKPADEDTGIRFRRTDLLSDNDIRVGIDNVVLADGHSGRQTTIGHGKAIVQTVEHLLASLHVLGITNIIIEVNSAELPALDGSAIEYVNAIKKTGVAKQNKEQSVFSVSEPLSIDFNGNTTTILPADALRITYTLNYNNPALSEQNVTFEVTPEIFTKELAPARTFCLKEEAEALLAAGYGKGANYQNTLVFEDNAPIENTLRFDDEAARHKVIDLIGDLYLLGQPVKGHIITAKTGHAQNFELVKKIYESKEKTMTEKNAKTIKDSLDFDNLDFDINKIMAFMPHRYPFLLVDRVIELDPGKRIVAIKNVTITEPFFQGHFPGHPIMPGVLIVEAMAQAGGIVSMMKEDHPEEKVAYFMSIDKAKFRAPVIPGDQLRFEVNVIKSKGRIGVCDCKAFVEEKLVCSAEVMFTIMDK